MIDNGVQVSLLCTHAGYFTRVHCCLGDQHRTFQWPGSWRFMAQGIWLCYCCWFAMAYAGLHLCSVVAVVLVFKVARRMSTPWMLWGPAPVVKIMCGWAPIEICIRFAIFSTKTLGFCAPMQMLVLLYCQVQCVQKSVWKTFQFITQCTGDIVTPLKQQKSPYLTRWCAEVQMCPYKTSCCAEHM